MKYCKNPNPSSAGGRAISKRAFDRVPERHSTTHERNDSNVEESLADRLSIANVDGQAKEQNQIGDAIPVMEVDQRAQALEENEASSRPSSSTIRAVSCGL